MNKLEELLKLKELLELGIITDIDFNRKKAELFNNSNTGNNYLDSKKNEKITVGENEKECPSCKLKIHKDSVACNFCDFKLINNNLSDSISKPIGINNNSLKKYLTIFFMFIILMFFGIWFFKENNSSNNLKNETNEVSSDAIPKKKNDTSKNNKTSKNKTNTMDTLVEDQTEEETLDNSPKYTSNSSDSGANISVRKLISGLFQNRKIIFKPLLDCKCKSFGKVDVEVTINKSGEVINYREAIRGTTNTDKCLLDFCRVDALSTKWEVDENAPEKQIGTIMYDFEKSD